MAQPRNIRDMIISAFSNVEYPGDGIVPKDASDDSMFAIANLLGFRCKFPSHEHLAPSHDETLGALSEEGFRYYLPGLLLLCIDDPEASATLPHAIVDRLTASERHDESCIHRKERRIAILSTEQRLALSAFLEHLETLNEFCPDLLAAARENVTSGIVRITQSEIVNRWVDSQLRGMD